MKTKSERIIEHVSMLRETSLVTLSKGDATDFTKYREIVSRIRTCTEILEHISEMERQLEYPELLDLEN